MAPPPRREDPGFPYGYLSCLFGCSPWRVCHVATLAKAVPWPSTPRPRRVRCASHPDVVLRRIPVSNSFARQRTRDMTPLDSSTRARRGPNIPAVATALAALTVAALTVIGTTRASAAQQPAASGLQPRIFRQRRLHLPRRQVHGARQPGWAADGPVRHQRPRPDHRRLHRRGGDAAIGHGGCRCGHWRADSR